MPLTTEITVSELFRLVGLPGSAPGSRTIGVYPAVKGEWQKLPTAGSRVVPEAWHTLRVRADGDRLAVVFDRTPAAHRDPQDLRQSAGRFLEQGR